MAAEIRRLRASSIRPPEIASMVGVSVRTVQEVLAGKRDGRPLSARERFDEDAATGWAPACMDAVEWAEWGARNPLANIPEADQVARPCEECPIGWAADMRAEGRCNGIPGGVAEDLADDAQEVHVMQPENTANVIHGAQIPVSLEAPCGRCEKADVCAIRPTLEALSSLPVQPRLDARISLELVGSVGCTAFVKARQRPATPAQSAADGPAGRKLNLTPEDRERRRQQALRMGAEQRARRAEAVAS